MVYGSVKFLGNDILEKDHNYEVNTLLNSKPIFLEIRNDVAQEFQKKYSKPINEIENLLANVDLYQQGKRVEKCKFLFRAPDTPVAIIDSIDDIVPYNPKVDLKILGLMDACLLKPTEKTYAIRIFSSQMVHMNGIHLEKEGNYVKEITYNFDDNDYGGRCGPVTFDTNLAKQIIEDFSEYKDSIESLMVHCTKGENRSPAVAIALNEIFNLGHPSLELKLKYKELNELVYERMIEGSEALNNN